MADKMWDILRFLKNPDGDRTPEGSASTETEAKKDLINERLINAIEEAEQLVDIAAGEESKGAEELSVVESAYLTTDLDADEREESAPNGVALQDASQPQPHQPRNARDTADAKPLPDISSHDAGQGGERLLKIPVADITPNPYQPRKAMGEDEIGDLSASIKELGVLQPILVKQVDKGYELIAGERRLRAAQRVGLSEIPAMVIEAQPLTQQIIALVENIQRKNLTSIEEALCLQDILSKTGWSQTELSQRMGRSQASIANKLRLLRLDQAVQDLIVAGKLGERQARSLLSLSVDEQRLLAQKAIDEDLSARALEHLSETWGGRNQQSAKSPKKAKTIADGPAGELLHDLATLINKHRSAGVSAQWKVKQMNQSSLVVEISVDLLNNQTANSTEESF